MGVNSLQISCMLICKIKTNLVNVIFTMTLLITLHVRKSDFSSRELLRIDCTYKYHNIEIIIIIKCSFFILPHFLFL